MADERTAESVGTSMEPAEPAKKKRAPRAPKIAGLNQTEFAYLRRMLDGEQIHAARTFPYAFGYRITGRFDQDKGTHVGAGPISPGAVANLVSAKAIGCPRVTSTTDYVIYTLTPFGRELAHGHVPPPDATQKDMFESGEAA